MQIEAWLVVAACEMDDLPIAGFNAEGEAIWLAEILNAMTDDQQERIFADAVEQIDPPCRSGFIGFCVRHVPKGPVLLCHYQPSAKPAGECPASK